VDLAESLSALSDDEVATMFELLALSRARRAMGAGFSSPEAA
jgi:hypothetical protein